ncbi:Retrotransposon-derived protein PEG10 [Smittium culicis]|uniref:Retrotransposon-derived protein PEG10 n=1 Tax=Smittium culicis TaxID=133412 RepID=A0A1R1YP42_9FUNG|nr:Retrotransposon-derived protein PEG10 [Smittium culicis]
MVYLFAVDIPNSLEEVMDMAIRVENRINCRNKYGSNILGTSFISPRNYISNFTESTIKHEPMEIDALYAKRKGPLSDEERERRVKNNLCLYCGEGGHYKNNCPRSKYLKAKSQK